MIDWLLLALMAGSPATTVPAFNARCTMVPATPSMVRADDDGYLLLRARPESVFVERFTPREFNLRNNRTVELPPVDVYGQVFEIIRASNRHTPGGSGPRLAVIVWWTHDTMCQRQAPDESVKMDAAEILVINPLRPSSRWANGMPTVDMGMIDFVAPPASILRRPIPGTEPMTAAEFAAMYDRLPTERGIRADSARAVAPLLAWADEDSRRWRLHPARYWLCEAAQVAKRQERRCTPGR